MALVIKQSETLKNTLIVIFKNTTLNINYSKIGDFTIIKSNDEIVSLNIRNSDTYLNSNSGTHTLTNEQFTSISKHLDLNSVNRDFKMFECGEVISREIHPSSKKLFVLKVKTTKVLQIVTNSLNSLPTKKVVVANIGAILLNGMPIIKTKVLNVVSEGMLCGGEILNLAVTDGVLLVDNLNAGDEFII